MKNHLAPILALPLFLTACKAVNECDDPAIRAQYHAAVQKTIEVPICIHTVYPDEATKDSLEVEGTEEVESTDDAYTRIYIQNPNDSTMAGHDPYGYVSYTGEMIGIDTKIRLYEFAPRDVIVDEYWGHADDYLDSNSAGKIVRHDLAASNNTEGCMNLYVIESDLAYSDKFGYATLPNNSPWDNYVMLWDTESGKFAHELGHALGLLHTDAPNGDYLEDTPYDPGDDYCQLMVDSTTGEFVGACDAPYEEYGPGLPIENIMASYGWLVTFTKDQIERMHCTWSRHEDDIYPH